MVKKAQMKIQQTAFLLLAVTLFFILAGIFALGFRISSLKETASALEEKNAALLVSRLANSPEFSCGNSYGISRVNCVDADKFMALKKQSVKYRNFWGAVNIEIRKIYPVMDGEVDCEGVYPDCNIMRLRTGTDFNFTSVENFVSLCRKESQNNQVYDKCEMAILMVDYKKEQW